MLLQPTIKMSCEAVGAGRPLVLVPGGLTGWLSWEPHAARLAPTRRVLRVQLLNVQYGLDGCDLPSGYRVETESRALAATLEDAGLEEPFDLVAWSYGALVTLDYALDHPDLVRTLTLIEPPALWLLGQTDQFDQDVVHQVALFTKLRGDIREDMLADFMNAVGLTPPDTSPRELPQWPVFARHRQSLRHSPAVVEHRDDVRRLRAFTRPVLLVKGTGSAPFLHRIIDALATSLPRAQVVELPAGHAPHIVSMDAFLERLAHFQR